MTTKKAKDKIKKAGGNWKTFEKWMRGQTVGLYPNGETDWYKWDVDRFIAYKCNPKNESISEFD